ncbi:glycoside hydrolase superfamily [Lipomyces japonicus]|uniref:glycoside hydrolase superfamily n=1 Tax=Lipomyces japonicus TaxID=56871 RepID=UPI0034CFED3E
MTGSAFLKVKGTIIVDDHNDEQVVLKGVGLGGMLNMENFITGYPGHETEHKKSVEKVLGTENTKFFFDKFYEYFFDEADAKFLVDHGLNAVRVPFNHRHFIDDDNPAVIKERGFELLDRIVNICAKYGIYTILDLHTVPGGQNQDWHSDSGIHRALFWDFRDFQDRIIQLWIVIATRYRNNKWIAGYNPLNEPADPEHTRLWDFYVRVEKSIRSVDPNHILFLDGNTYAGDFTRFGEPLPNSVYAIHDYSFFGFPTFEQFEGNKDQVTKLQRSFDRKVKEARDLGIPVWNGEFGPVYEDEVQGGDAAVVINKKRYDLLKAQLKIYKNNNNVSWSLWTYKDVGVQGLAYVPHDSPWRKLFGDFIEKKRRVGADFWGANPDSEVEKLYDDLFEHFKREIPDKYHKVMYPPLWNIRRQITRVTREIVLSSYLAYEYADLLQGYSKDDLDKLAASWKLENCVLRNQLNQYLYEDSK